MWTTLEMKVLITLDALITKFSTILDAPKNDNVDHS